VQAFEVGHAPARNRANQSLERGPELARVPPTYTYRLLPEKILSPFPSPEKVVSMTLGPGGTRLLWPIFLQCEARACPLNHFLPGDKAGRPRHFTRAGTICPNPFGGPITTSTLRNGMTVRSNHVTPVSEREAFVPQRRKYGAICFTTRNLRIFVPGKREKNDVALAEPPPMFPEPQFLCARAAPAPATY